MTERDRSLDELRPAPEDITAESPFTLPGFFAALESGQLIAGRCLECSEYLLPPRPACYRCGSRKIQLQPQPETGTVYSYTEVRYPTPSFPVEAPFTVGIVELDSGARMTGRIADPYEEIEIGTDVALSVREPTDPEKQYALEHEKDWPIHLFEAD